MKKLLPHILFLFSFNTSVFSQSIKNKDTFTEIVAQEEGDLNNDKKPDKVILEMDVKSDTRPLRVQIFLSQPNIKTSKLIVSSTKIIESQYPKNRNGQHNGNPIPDFFIEDGNLQMLTDINDLKSRYTFKFQNGNFELIKISRIISDGKEMTTETEIDLLKGNKVVFDQDFGPNKRYKVREKFNTKPLPKIQDLTSSDLIKF